LFAERVQYRVFDYHQAIKRSRKVSRLMLKVTSWNWILPVRLFGAAALAGSVIGLFYIAEDW
jgi:hypothetical protein